jgi:hypothetical protein
MAADLTLIVIYVAVSEDFGLSFTIAVMPSPTSSASTTSAPGGSGFRSAGGTTAVRTDAEISDAVCWNG